MRIAIASGKGGTGKSTVAANLAWALARSRDVALVDCDVEEPNLHLFFPAPATEMPVTTPVPEIDAERCTLCGECGKFCRFGALAVLKDSVLTFPHLCHSCGGCTLVCPQGAVREVPRTIGRVTCSRPLPRLTLISGILNEGEVFRRSSGKDAAARRLPGSARSSRPSRAMSILVTSRRCSLHRLAVEECRHQCRRRSTGATGRMRRPLRSAGSMDFRS